VYFNDRLEAITEFHLLVSSKKERFGMSPTSANGILYRYGITSRATQTPEFYARRVKMKVAGTEIFAK
jgi:hypothetical protein